MAQYGTRGPLLTLIRGQGDGVSYEVDKYGVPRRVPDAGSTHRFEALGADCISGRVRYDPIHFNGDLTLARLAKQNADFKVRRLQEFREGLRVGDRVQVTDDHPRQELVGRAGTISAFPRINRTSRAATV